MRTMLTVQSLILSFLVSLFFATDALACSISQDFVQPTPSQLMARAEAVIYGPIEVINGKILIQPEKTLKKTVTGKIAIIFGGGTCGSVQPDWLKTGDYCLVFFDTIHSAGMYSSCTLGDKNGTQKKKLDSLFDQLTVIHSNPPRN